MADPVVEEIKAPPMANAQPIRKVEMEPLLDLAPFSAFSSRVADPATASSISSL